MPTSSNDDATPPASTLRIAATDSTSTTPQPARPSHSILVAPPAALPPSTSTRSIFQQQTPSHVATGHRARSIMSETSPSTSPTRARAPSRGAVRPSTAPRLPSMTGSIGGSVTETDSIMSGDVEGYFDDEAYTFSEMETPAEEAPRQRPRTGRSQTTPITAGSSKGRRATTGKPTTPGKGKDRASRRQSLKPQAGDSDSDDGGGQDVAPLLGGAAVTNAGEIEDDEVERVDRGEELVRRRMRERQRIKKEAERKRRQDDQAKLAGSQPRLVRLKSSQQIGQRESLAQSSETGSFDAGRQISLSAGVGLPPPTMTDLERRVSALDPGYQFERAHKDRRSNTMTSEGSEAFPKSRASTEVGEGDATPTLRFASPRLNPMQLVDPIEGIPLPPKSPSLHSGPQRRSGTRVVSYSGSIGSESAGRPLSLGISPRVGSGMLSVDRPEAVQEEDSRDVDVADLDDVLSQNDDAEAPPQAIVELDEHDETTPEIGGDSSSDVDDGDVEYTLKDRQDAINIEHPFGLRIWKPALYKKSRSVARNAEAALHNDPLATSASNLKVGNLVWAAAFGSWLAIICLIVAAIMFFIPWGGQKYGGVVYELAGYLFWPFGKYVEETIEDDSETSTDKRCGFSTAHSSGNDGYGARDANGGTLTSRWEAVSDAGDDDVESSGLDWRHYSLGGSTDEDNGTIRGVEHVGETTRLVPPMTGKKPPFNHSLAASTYGATNSTIDEAKRRHASGASHLSNSQRPSKLSSGSSREESRRVRALGRVSYWVAYYLILAPLMIFVCALCWALVFTIPMAKLLGELVVLLGQEPLALHFRPPPTFVTHNPPNSTEAGADASSPIPDSMDEQSMPRLVQGQLAPNHSAKTRSADLRKGRYVKGSGRVTLCVYSAFGLQYYKYTVDGVNIIFIILMPVVLFVIIDDFFVEPLHLHGALSFLCSQTFIFIMALASVIPLSYFIGMAVASISAQSSIGMGAVINATFGSIIEILLYGIALTKGKGELVEGSIIGSMLAGVLLMPGMSMIGGAFRRKEQKFNARSAGVTSTMLIMAIIGALTPTLFYEIYGTFQLSCEGCPDDGPRQAWSCNACRYEHLPPADDPFYQDTVRGLATYCAVLLVLSYLIGLWFSLRTHASQIWQSPAQQVETSNTNENSRHTSSMAPEHHRTSMMVRKLPELLKQHVLPQLQNNNHNQASSSSNNEVGNLTEADLSTTVRVLQFANHTLNRRPSHFLGNQNTSTAEVSTNHQREISKSMTEDEGHGSHDAPNWSRAKSATVLLGCTVLYAIIAEILVDVVDSVLDGSGIPEKFLGITLFALVPNTTEFMNAISFAINGNIALSMEIGSAYALQVCLIQIPAMILFSGIYNAGRKTKAHYAFTLVFPRWDVIAIMFSVFLLTYTYIEARANYYRGTILVLSYLVLIGGFYAAPTGLDTADDPMITKFAIDSLHKVSLPLMSKTL